MTRENQKSKDRVGKTDTTQRPEASEDFREWASRLIDNPAHELDEGELATLKAQVAGVGATPTSQDLPPDPTQPTIVRSAKALADLAAKVEQADEVVIDLETSSLDHRNGVIVGLGLALNDRTSYVPINHRFIESGELRPNQLLLVEVSEALSLQKKSLIAHNAKYELKWLQRHFRQEFRFVWDTMLAGRLLRSDKPADLKSMATRELDVPAWELSKAEIEQIEFLSIEKAASYCAKDCWYTSLLSEKQRSAGPNEFLLNNVEMPLVKIVAEMEDVGYRVDVDFFHKLRATLELELDETMDRIAALVGDDEFNPGSTQQLQRLLFDQLGEKPTTFTKAGKPSTDKSEKARLADRHEVVKLIVKHRKLEKLLGTYCGIPDKVSSDQRLRVEFNQLGAETGRFASKSVIQTLPKNDQYGIRKGFVAAPSHQLLKGDFVQQELCVLAQVSGDKNMQKAVIDGTDLHGLAAVKVFNLDCQPNEVKVKHKARRDEIKAIQFGLIYGKTPDSLAMDLNISKEEARKLIKDYFAQFPAIRRFVEGIRKQVATSGYIDDMFGRRRYLPDAQLSIPRKRGDQRRKISSRVNGAKRAAQNFVIQGASATITKLAMIRCNDRIHETYRDTVKLILTLHDELQFEVRDDVVAEFASELPSLMCQLGLERFGFTVPLAVEVEIGPSWGETEPWKGGQNGESSVHNER